MSCKSYIISIIFILLDVVIRTNSASTNLGLNAPNDDIYFYGTVGKICGVEENTGAIVAPSSLHIDEKAEVAYIKIAQGHIENKGTIDLIYATSSNVTVTNTGDIDHAHGAKADAVAINGAGTTTGVKFDYNENTEQNNDPEVYHHVTEGTEVAGNKPVTGTETWAEGKVDAAAEEVVDTAEVANIDYWIDAAAKEFAGGSGTEADPYIITNNRELALVAKLVNDSGTTGDYRTCYYKITKDINLSGKVWTPIGFDGYDFAGTIFADSKVKISNLSNKNKNALLTNTEDSIKKTKNYGLVGKATGTISISNLQFENIDAQYVDGYAGGFGGVVGYFDNTTGATNVLTISNVDILSGTILCTYSQTGGIVGKAYGDKTIISSCTNAATVSGSFAAGIVGFASNGSETIEITGCSNSGNITASSGRAAGILGSATIKQLTIGDCDNSGNILGSSEAAGIAAPDKVNDGNIVFYDLENSGEITSSTKVAAGISVLNGDNKNLYVQKGEGKENTYIKNTGSVSSGSKDAAGIFGGNVMVGHFYAYNCQFENSGEISCATASTVTKAGNVDTSSCGISALFGFTANATFENCEFINKGNVTSNIANAGLIFAALTNTGSNTGYTFTNCTYKNSGTISGIGVNNKQEYNQYFDAKLFGYICSTSKIVEGSSLNEIN